MNQIKFFHNPQIVNRNRAIWRDHKTNYLHHSVVYMYRLRTQNLRFVAPVPVQSGTPAMLFPEHSFPGTLKIALWWWQFVLAWVQRISVLRHLQVSAP